MPLEITATTITPAQLDELATQYTTGNEDNNYTVADNTDIKTALTADSDTAFDTLIAAAEAYRDSYVEGSQEHMDWQGHISTLTSAKASLATSIDGLVPNTVELVKSDLLTDTIKGDINAAIAGSYTYICATCRGNTTVRQGDLEGNDPSSDAIITCPTCAGLGKTATQYRIQFATIAISS